ncbi:MAG TPA: glycosyltransferase family 2 protein [Roseiflexaceae bacterium]|nr:glycosyltransferase family 2 protein [Roseiflexaceae bacterium]HMP39242.1 glycosyltransferase family 2 protein [Roseiflexaceae bacterium]
MPDRASKTTPDVSVILVNWNTRELICDCIASLPAALGRLHGDVWVIDNNSSDDSVAAIRERFPDVHVIANEQNAGFAAANNQGIVASSGRYALLLNSDTVAPAGSIEQLVDFADAHPQAGMVGAMLLDPDGTFQSSFADFPSILSETLSVTGIGARLLFRNFPSYPPQASRSARRVDYVFGACMLARRSAIAQVGTIDEGYFMYSEEPDWCMALHRAGWEIWYTPDAKIIHYGGQSTRRARFAMVQALYRSKVRFFYKHYARPYAITMRAVFTIILGVKWMLRSIAAAVRRIPADPRIGWRDLAPEAIERRPPLAGASVSGN